MDRRQFCQAVAALPLVAAAGPTIGLPKWNGLDLSWTNGIPPLFCTAYIDPTIAAQAGQERAVARYPRAIVSQGGDPASRVWRRRVRELNPSIQLFAYQVVIEETTVPGPGHAHMRRVQQSWVTYPGGYVPTVEVLAGHRFRVFDPRSAEWQQSFVEACEILMESDQYDGLYLDQCTVYGLAAPLPGVRDEMLEALASTLNQLRRRMPSVTIVGNSSYDFSALNGELNENRPADLRDEAQVRDHASPEVNLFQFLTDGSIDSPQAKSMAHLALENRCMFGIANNYQKVGWPSFFDEIVAATKSG